MTVPFHRVEKDGQQRLQPFAQTRSDASQSNISALRFASS